eukprot:c18306_g1_i1 orf=285-983(+)
MKNASELQWHTTSREYGKFYDYIKDEEEDKRFQRERDRRCEVLTKDVINCKAQLDVLGLRDPSPSRPQHAVEPSEKPCSSYLENYTREGKGSYGGSKDLSKNSSQTESGPSIEKVPSVQQDSTSGERSPRENSLEIEEGIGPLEWILHRLADKLQPLRKLALLMKASKYRYSQSSTPTTHCTGPPPCHRYNFYKYYGYAGQGARTSWGHNLPLGQEPPFGKKTQRLQTFALN